MWSTAGSEGCHILGRPESHSLLSTYLSFFRFILLGTLIYVSVYIQSLHFDVYFHIHFLPLPLPLILATQINTDTQSEWCQGAGSVLPLRWQGKGELALFGHQQPAGGDRELSLVKRWQPFARAFWGAMWHTTSSGSKVSPKTYMGRCQEKSFFLFFI